MRMERYDDWYARTLPRWTCSECGAHVRAATPRHAGWAGEPGSHDVRCWDCADKHADQFEEAARIKAAAKAAAEPATPSGPRLVRSGVRAAAALREDPTRSNLAIAEELGVDNRTVSRARTYLEAQGEIPPVHRRGVKRAGV